MDDQLLGTNRLKERGWTPTMINKLLGEPDEYRPNPYYRTAHPMRLYCERRVQQVEDTPAFTEACAKAAVRSKRGRDAAERQAKDLERQAGAMPIHVKQLSSDAVRHRAIRHFNERREWWDDDFREADLSSDRHFLDRITVNYIRHHLTGYDRHLETVAGKVGVERAVSVIRGRVYEAIGDSYPHLAYSDEAVRQFRRKASSGSGAKHPRIPVEGVHSRSEATLG